MEHALAASFEYFFLLERADSPVTVFHEALRACALETAVRMAPFEPVKMEVDLHNINANFSRYYTITLFTTKYWPTPVNMWTPGLMLSDQSPDKTKNSGRIGPQ